MRQIAPLQLGDLVPATAPGTPPEIEIVPPASLFIDPRYQRDLSERSIRLIRKIVSEWDWTAFKPPVVARVDERLDVLDGQHTAIAAVTHGGIPLIPVLVVAAPEEEKRAGAFVRHNRDRISVTPTQLHSALVAAGDEDAMTIAQVCERAGVTILKNPPPYSRFRPGDTMAISTIASLVSRRYAVGARRVLDICVRSGAAPVSAHMIRGVECLVFAKEYAGEIDDDRISLIIRVKGEELEREAKRFAIERKVPFWRAYASVLFMNRRKARG
ncbi:DUF6551 family protein [Shinella pollutisoli]|uniref:DUF6551 family protein n=1 Tax=Shinella pollutisoli TaxID=2250594 RepID=A0ABV7DK18_9HYPH|nr:DUF6551 family protein [Shinella pollutisoli]